jgi:hypothetical protein
MAIYKQGQLLNLSKSTAFDATYSPGVSAPYPGIYRCIACDDEIAIAGGNMLPPQNHHQHGQINGQIKWKLLVMAVQK